MHRSLIAAAALAGLLAAASPAAARIECSQGMQRVAGQYIATPYCQDTYLAEVARTYGMRTSAEAIRNNPSAKREVCRLIGRDIRVRDNCPEETAPRGGR